MSQSELFEQRKNFVKKILNEAFGIEFMLGNNIMSVHPNVRTQQGDILLLNETMEVQTYQTISIISAKTNLLYIVTYSNVMVEDDALILNKVKESLELHHSNS